MFLSDFFQLLLSCGDLRFQILFHLLGSRQLPLRLLPAVLQLGQTSGNFLLLFLQIVIARLGLLLLLPGCSHVHTRRILPDEFLLQLLLRLIQLHPQESALLPDFLRFLQQGIHLLQRRFDLFLKLFDLPAASQQVAAVLKRAAADRSAGRKKLALQRDHAQAVACLSGKPYRVVHMIDHQNPAKQRSRHIPVFFLRGHQRIRKADDARLRKQLPLAEFRPELRSALHAGQRQEGGSSALHRLQEGDHFLCGILVVRHDVLDAAAKSRFDGGFILFLHLQKVRHHAENAGMLLLLLHDPLDAPAVALIALRQVDQSVQSGFFLMIDDLRIAHRLILLRQPVPDPVQLFLQSADGIIQSGNALADPVELLFQLLDARILLFLVRFGPKQPGVQLRSSDLHLFQHGIEASHPGLDGGAFVQHFNDPAAPFVNKAVGLIRPCLDGSQKGRCMRPLLLHLRKIPVSLFLAGLDLFPLLRVFLNLPLQSFFTSRQMAGARLCGIDLFL